MANGLRREFQHIHFLNQGESSKYTSPITGGGGRNLLPRNRAVHGARLSEDLDIAVRAAEVQMDLREDQIASGTKGFYLEIDIPKSQNDILDMLENRQGRETIEIVSVKPSPENPENLISATVFVPESKKDNYKKKIDAYSDPQQSTSGGNPKNEPLVTSINTFRLARARSLFTDDPASFPDDGAMVWWEVWLRAERLQDFFITCEVLNIVCETHSVSFAERDVVLVHASSEALGRIVANTDQIAELRISRDTPAQFIAMPISEQIDWAQELIDRIDFPAADAPAVCVLDSGSTRLHPLLEPVLAEGDQQAWHPDWAVEDISINWGGHGTQMSGLTLFGDLRPVLEGAGNFELGHQLESVKILPDHGENDPALYGHITASATSLAEIQAPNRPRVFCLAVTADGANFRGKPSQWSAKVDDLAFGEGVDERLIVVSAGNIRDYYPSSEYLDQNDTAVIDNPAQAWNALTVGAMTEKCNIVDADFDGWTAMAPAGDLSPLSRTSVTFSDDWPIKPEVVFEGGNHGVDPILQYGDHIDDLSLLTTFNRTHERLFTTTGDTSAATAQVSRMAAQILADRPAYWPETVRALIIHSANWTPKMRSHFPANLNRQHKKLLLGRYGYGCPDILRAKLSSRNDVTLVSEDTLKPFWLDGTTIKTNEMNLHEFPWPSELLENNGADTVQMRVTLSYFVEPNPGERGWTKRHKYSSHGLRFAVKRADENIASFRRRINKAARDEAGVNQGGGDEGGWILGPQARNKGSIHSDIWEGSAADLANKNAIAVYPTAGWWKEKRTLERSGRTVRYSLIVTLIAEAEIDLYTQIEAQIPVEAGIEVEIEV